MTIPALSIRGVRRTFGQNVAVDDVDLTIEAGTFTGLLGPNGAGKSTLIECTFGARTDAAPQSC